MRCAECCLTFPAHAEGCGVAAQAGLVVELLGRPEVRAALGARLAADAEEVRRVLQGVLLIPGVLQALGARIHDRRGAREVWLSLPQPASTARGRES